MEDLLLIWFHPFCIAAAVKCFSHCKLSIRNTMSFLICECLATTHTLPHTYTQHVHNAHTHNTGIHTWAYMHIYTHFHIHIHNNAQCTHTYTHRYTYTSIHAHMHITHIHNTGTQMELTLTPWVDTVNRMIHYDWFGHATNLPILPHIEECPS